MWGAEDYPTIFTEHPIENLDRDQLRQRAEGLGHGSGDDTDWELGSRRKVSC